MIMVWNTGQWEYNSFMSTQPFAHTELELKQHFIKLARDFHAKSSTIENELSAGLIYMNVADYLAEYLVVGLGQMAEEAMNKYYLGVVSVKPLQLGNFNIGDSMKRLKEYDFPKKAEIIEELGKINKARKQLAHQILKTDSTKLDVIDKAVQEMAIHTEKLVELVDALSLGMPPKNLIEKIDEDNK